MATISLAAPIPLTAGLVVTTTPLQLQPDKSGQWVTLFLQNSGWPVEISGLELNIQIADGGPELYAFGGRVDGPSITEVDLVSNTLFEGENANISLDLQFPQLWVVSLDLDSGSVHVPNIEEPQLVLARVRLDTSGLLPSTDQWSFSINQTLNGPSQIFGSLANPIPLNTSTDTIRLSAVPELEHHAVYLGLAMIAFVWHRKLFRKKAARQSKLE